MERPRQLGTGDRQLIEAFFTGLGRTSSRDYFLGGVKPSPQHFRWIDELDGDARIAVGAFDTRTGVLLGLAQCARDSGDSSRAEVAIAVADAWQRRGLGLRLARELARLAGSGGITRLWGTTLAGNAGARNLASKVAAPRFGQARAGLVDVHFEMG
jgi:RimJ/RimL family protein N-acetyltransferase